MAKIMVVDDEHDIRLLVRYILEKEGYEVSEAGTGVECLDKVKEEKPDLILLDIMMPELGGWETCKKLKEDEETMGIPVAMFTVRTSQESREKSLTYAKADAQIDKPFDIEGLLETIKSLLG